jgi:two-component system, NtrC family, sensor kinase
VKHVSVHDSWTWTVIDSGDRGRPHEWAGCPNFGATPMARSGVDLRCYCWLLLRSFVSPKVISMGILEKIPTFLTVGVLVIIFVCLKRQTRSAQLTLWTIGWALVFTHFLAQLLEPDRGHVSSLLLAIDSAALQAAAVGFLVSMSSVAEDDAKRTRLLLVLGVPSITYVALASYEVSARWPYVLCLIVCFVGGGYRLVRANGRMSPYFAATTFLCSLAGAWAIRAAIDGSFDEGSIALLGIGYGLAGVFICRNSSRLSPATLTIAGGFLVWGAVFPIGLLVDRLAPNLIIPGELWNTPKFFVAFGMILAVVEDKSKSIAGMKHKADALNRQLERFSAITSQLLGGARPDAACPAIASAITEITNFRVAVVQLEDAERRLWVAGTSGLSPESSHRLQAQTQDWTIDHIKSVCSHAQRVGRSSYSVAAYEAIPFAPTADRITLRGNELLIPLCSPGGSTVGCIRLAEPRDPNAIDALELSHIEMLAADLAVAVELKALHTQLVWSEKLAALGQLLAGVAHELNNPLTVIMGYGELITDAIAAPHTRDQLVKMVNEARRMKRIIGNLLRFSRQSARETQTVQLSPLVQDVLALREYHTRTRNVRVELDIAQDLPSLAANEDEIKQILLNLFNNSSDALEGIAGAKQIKIRAYQNGIRAVIEVEDTGPGFGNLNRALDPFYTTKPVGKGTGLGLSVCYGIVKERGGDLRIENVQPHGARVIIELPVVAATSEPLLEAVALA